MGENAYDDQYMSETSSSQPCSFEFNINNILNKQSIVHLANAKALNQRLNIHGGLRMDGPCVKIIEYM